MKKISIITVVKNGMPYLKSAIQSVKNQINYEEVEYIIICSPSDDGTEEYLKKINDVKVIYDLDSKNKFGSINLGIKNTSTNIIGLLHADDIFFYKNTLKKIISKFKDNTDVLYGNILFSKRNSIKKIIRKWKSSNFNIKKLKMGWMPPHTSLFLKKEIYLKNLYDCNYPISGDYYFILKLFSLQNLNYTFFNEYICIMRAGGDSTSPANIFKKFNEDMRILSKFYKISVIINLLKIFQKVFQFKIFSETLENDYLNELDKL